VEKSAVRRSAAILLCISTLIIVGGVWWSYRHQYSGIAIAVLGIVPLLYGCIFVFPTLLVDPTKVFQLDMTDKKTSLEYLTLVNSIRQTLLQVVLGIGVLAAAMSALSQFLGAPEQLNLTRDRFVSEQLSKATELLSKPELDSRMGALYTLQFLSKTTTNERIRQDSTVFYLMLGAYVKAHSPWPPLRPDKDQIQRGANRYNPLSIESLRRRAPDVQLALDILGAPNKNLPDGETFVAALADTDLRGATLTGLHLSNADLKGAALDYSDSRYDQSDPNNANLTYPDFSMADLRGASLRCAHLEGTKLQGAKLQGVDLRDADLRPFPPSPSSQFTKPNADLVGANLDGAIYNGLTQWPDGFDLAKNPKLRQDDELFARSTNGTDILLVKGATVDWQEGWDKGGAFSNPIVKGGGIVGVFDGTKWGRYSHAQPSTVNLRALTCQEYQYVKSWPDSVGSCRSYYDRRCPHLPQLPEVGPSAARADKKTTGVR
jgi:uncharacterized protein YjbI with pentapeptide repeats